MSNSINLIKQRKTAAKQITRQEKWFRFISLIALVLIVVVSVGIYGMKLLSPLPSLQQEEQRQREVLTKLYPTTAKLLFLKNRITEITKVLNSRPNLIKTIDLVRNKKPTDVTLSTMAVTIGGVTFDAQSRSLASVDSYLNTLTDIATKEKAFKTVTLENLALSPESGYTFSLNITL